MKLERKWVGSEYARHSCMKLLWQIFQKVIFITHYLSVSFYRQTDRQTDTQTHTLPLSHIQREICCFCLSVFKLFINWPLLSICQCSKTCGGKGFKTRAINCIWALTGKPAGDNCKYIRRPELRKECNSPKTCVTGKWQHHVSPLDHIQYVRKVWTYTLSTALYIYPLYCSIHPLEMYSFALQSCERGSMALDLNVRKRYDIVYLVNSFQLSINYYWYKIYLYSVVWGNHLPCPDPLTSGSHVNDTKIINVYTPKPK